MAGISVVGKCVESLTDPADNYNVILDMLGYDGQCAAYCLKEHAAGNHWAAATICHSDHETAFVGELTANKVFSAARAGQLKLPGFPNFQSVVAELKAKQTQPFPEYSVCTALPDGTLVIKQALIELWTQRHEMFCTDMEPGLHLVILLPLPLPTSYC